jgi:TolA-binding protein
VAATAASGGTTPAAPGTPAAAPVGRAATRGTGATPASGAAPAGGAAAAGTAAAQIAEEIRLANAKVEARLFDQALTDLRGIVARNSGNPAAANAYLLMGTVLARQNKPDDAMAAYVDLRSSYGSSPAAAEGTFRLAELLQRSRRSDRDAASMSLLDELIMQHASSPWAPRALVARAAIEERTRRRVVDAQLNTSVPAQLLTYRTLVEQYPGAAGEEVAFEKLGEMYDDLRRYDLAAQAFLSLGQKYPDSARDGAWRAAEIYEKRVKDMDKARAAYAMVPMRSKNYRDAQRKVQQQ